MFKQRKRMVSFVILMAMFMNLIFPNLAFAMETQNSNTVTLSVERRVLGQTDIINDKKIEIIEGENIAELVERIFIELGIEYSNTGSAKDSFYLSGVNTSDGWVEEMQHGKNSGWMYFVNGEKPNVGMSDYQAKNGDKIRIAYSAKEYGHDIQFVDKFNELKSRLDYALSIDRSKYTDESLAALDDEVGYALYIVKRYNNIGPMLSTELGNGDLDVDAAMEEVEYELDYLNQVIDDLEEKVEETPLPEFDMEIEPYSNWSEYDSVYLEEGRESVVVRLLKVKYTNELFLNGEKVEPIGTNYIVTLKKGENKFNIKSSPTSNYNFKINLVTMPYKIQGQVSPGETISIKLKGLKEQIINDENRPLLESQTVYKTNIPNLDKVTSEKILGAAPDRDDLSTITFTIPKETPLGEYKLSGGYVYHSWEGYSLKGGNKGEFSRLPEIKLNVVEKSEVSPEEPEPPIDTERPIIETDLKDGQTLTSDRLKFSASAKDDIDDNIKIIAKLNDEVLSPILNGRYDTRLYEGENIITLEAEDKAGNKEVQTYKIICNQVLEIGSSIIFNKEYVDLKNGEKHQIIAIDTPDRRGSEKEKSAKMTYEIISGKDVVSVDKQGEVTALKSGTAKISVKYAGLKNPGIVFINVKSENISDVDIKTSIDLEKYDIFYYENNNSNYKFTVDKNGLSDVKVSINDNNITEKDGSYSANLVNGHNIVKINAISNGKNAEKIYNIKAKPISINIKNMSRESEEIIQGDKVRIEFTGLETPVPKILRIYNPDRTNVIYNTNIPGLSDIEGQATQYDIATRNAIEFTVAKSGEFEFTDGRIKESWWGDKLYSERDISKEPPNTNAKNLKDEFSKLPSFKINVKTNEDFEEKFEYEIENADDLKQGSEVVLRFKNLDMPESSKKAMSAKTIYETDIKGLEIVESEDAVSDSSKLKIIKFTLPSDIKEGTYTLTNGRVYKQWSGSNGLWQNKDFYKGEMPEIKIVVKAQEPEEKPDEKPENPNVSEGKINASNWIMQNYKTSKYEDEWKVLGLSRGEIKTPSSYYSDYYKNLESVVKEKKGVLHRSKYTEYSRVIIILTALGYDPRDVAGYNLVEKLYDYKNVSKQGVNGVIFALIALDTNNYEISSTANNSRDMLIKGILDSQLEDGGFSLSGKTSEIDITAMAVTALSKYKNREDIKGSIEKALNYLSKEQSENGGFKSVDGETVESSAQVLIAINSLGISAADKRFVKNDNTIVDAIMKFKAQDGGFKHILSNDSSNAMATEQVLCALVSQDRLNSSKTSLYDMSDVKLQQKPDGGTDSDDNGTTDDEDGSDDDESTDTGNGSGSDNSGNTEDESGSNSGESTEGTDDSNNDTNTGTGNNGSTGGNTNNSGSGNGNTSTGGTTNQRPDGGNTSKPNKTQDDNNSLASKDTDKKDASKEEKTDQNESNNQTADEQNVENNTLNAKGASLSSLIIIFVSGMLVGSMLILGIFMIIKKKNN